MKIELYIGLDVHKDSITVAVAQGGRDGEVRLYGTISNDLHAIESSWRDFVRRTEDIPTWRSATKQARAGLG